MKTFCLLIRSLKLKKSPEIEMFRFILNLDAFGAHHILKHEEKKYVQLMLPGGFRSEVHLSATRRCEEPRFGPRSRGLVAL